MKIFFHCIFPLFFIFAHFSVYAQEIPVTDKTISKSYPFINAANNRIVNGKGLNPFFQKLLGLKKENKGVLSIVHIGDSHIQADYFTEIIRTGLQQFFGNAGRGLVFPFQLAQSNAPPDINSSSNTPWEYNRLAHPEIPIASGISGYCIRTNFSGAAIDIGLKPDLKYTPQTFDRLKLFLKIDSTVSWILQAANNNPPFLIRKEESDTAVFKEVVLDQSTDSFTLSSLPSDSLKEFYGVSLERSDPGIIYHTIGVNGATYNSYNSAPLFWKQLPALKADLYIISLGTNEAQKTGLDRATFLQQMDIFFANLKLISPDAAVLITTPADDFYKRHRPNAFLKQINSGITSYSTVHNLPLWDMYRITGGHGSSYKWLKRGLMNKDRVHFTNEGYRIQGALFFNALSKEYNLFLNSN